MTDIHDIIDKYKTGHRYFINLDFDNDEKMIGQSLIDSTFENCFFTVDFSNTDFSNSKFINCNLKCCDFTNCNLTNSIFENCSLESAEFKGATTDSVSFVNCSCYGQNVQLDKTTNKLISAKDPLVKELYDNLPEFSEMIDHTEDELAYAVYEELSLKLFDNITNSEKITDFTEKCFRFLNKLGDRNNVEIDNLLIVGIYEGLYANKRCNDIARQLLIGRNKEVYEHWMINGSIRSDY
jgi:uncharacterized protein YjbI with pentapeptide repeats